VNPTKPSDAEFYSRVHLMRREHHAADSSPARKSERHVFAQRQWLAFYGHDGVPHEESFREVDCCNLSTSGFAFITHEMPENDRLCVRLGGAGGYVFLSALTVHCTIVETPAGPAFKIGCRFTGRSSNDGSPIVESAAA
jgi:hypothetical protein